MKVAVITPYYKESLDILRRCHDSVAAQTHGCSHIMIADGHARPELADWPVGHIVLPFAHGDNGNTPRSIGAMSALNSGFDAVAYLDADNWFHPEHLESLVEAVMAAGVPIAYSDRFLVALDGTIMEHRAQEDSDPNFVDTSCILHTMQAARMIPMWAMMDQPLSPICDRIFVGIARILGLSHTRTNRQTAYYETNYKGHYLQHGLPLPAEPRIVDQASVMQNFSEQRCLERLGFSLKLSP